MLPDASDLPKKCSFIWQFCRTIKIKNLPWEWSPKSPLRRWARSLPLHLIRPGIFRGGSVRVRFRLLVFLVRSGRVRVQVVGFRVDDWVHRDVINHHRVVDLSAGAWDHNLVEFAHTLPASTEVLDFSFGHLTQFRLADVLLLLEAAVRRPSVHEYR